MVCTKTLNRCLDCGLSNDGSESIALHIHHGIEAGIVLQGGMIQVPGKDAVPLPTGAPIMNLRDVPHAGWTVAGDTVIKLYTVHIVDKGKPLYDAPKK